VGYVKNVWVNGDESKPLDQLRMNHVEDGIFAAAATADVAAESAADAQSELAGRLSETSLNGQYPVRLVWDGADYPARVEGAVNLFIGPEDPGLLMEDDDLWVPGDATTLDSVTAAMSDTSSDLFAATQIAATANPIFLDVNALALATGVSLNKVALGVSPDQIIAWEMPDASVSRVYATRAVPVGWNNIRVRAYWLHTTVSGSGDVTLVCNISKFATSGTVGGGTSSTQTAAVGAIDTVSETVFTGDNLVTPGEGFAVMFSRNATAGSDTFTGNVYLLGLKVERTA
jgi:hypothetical protein